MCILINQQKVKHPIQCFPRAFCSTSFGNQFYHQFYRYQRNVIVSRISFIYNDDAIQLHLRIFNAIVFGVSDIACARVYFDWARATSQALVQ